MIASSDVADYLYSQGLATRSELAAGLSVTRIPRRNLIYKVTRPGQGYVLKQGVGDEGRGSIATEAAAYRQLARDPGCLLDRYIPELVLYDRQLDAVIIELIGHGENLREYQLTTDRFSTRLARRLGEALAAFHQCPPPDGRRGFGEAPPWVLSIHRPDMNLLLHSSAASVELIRLIQATPQLGVYLDTLRTSWEPSTLIHNDVRWDNCVVHGKRSTGPKTRLKLVDFELAQSGDPLWDVGCALSDYVGLWIASIPITGDTQPDDYASLSRYPLPRLQPAIRALWNSYVVGADVDAEQAQSALEDATRYVAARLIQSAFERTQLTTQVSGSVILSLQVALNMFEDTPAASTELLGFAAVGASS